MPVLLLVGAEPIHLQEAVIPRRKPLSLAQPRQDYHPRVDCDEMPEVMFPAYLQPRCPVRLAIFPVWQLATLVVVGLLWFTPASQSTFAEESPIRFVDPPRRMQPRQFNEMGTSSFTTQATAWLAQQSVLVERTDSETIPPPPADEEAVIDCLQPLPLRSVVADVTLPEGALPTDVAGWCAATTPFVIDKRLSSGWAVTNFTWSATGMAHRPLYFEDVNAERYGYTMSYCLQPVISGARFFLTIPILPYKMAVECPHDTIYTLGHYRPGSADVPHRWHRIPLQVTAATVQVGVIAGLILLIP